MPLVDLGVEFEEVKDTDKFQPMDSGTYKFQVRDIKQTVVGLDGKTPGRPMLVWELEIVEHPKEQGRRQFYNTVLPWIGPDGTRDTSASGLLVAICKGVQKPWVGGQINTDEYLGAIGFLTAGQGTIKKGDRIGEPTNTIKIVVPK